MEILAWLALIALAPALIVGALGVAFVVGLIFVALPLCAVYELWHRLFCLVLRRPYHPHFDI